MKLSDHWVFVKEGETPILILGFEISKSLKEEIRATPQDQRLVINNLTKPLGESLTMYSEIK